MYLVKQTSSLGRVDEPGPNACYVQSTFSSQRAHSGNFNVISVIIYSICIPLSLSAIWIKITPVNYKALLQTLPYLHTATVSLPSDKLSAIEQR